jgi:hypothetical protein
MSENDHRTEAHLDAALKTAMNKRRSDALTLMRWGHSHWREPHYSEMRMPRQGDGTKHDVAYEVPVDFGDKGHD